MRAVGSILHRTHFWQQNAPADSANEREREGEKTREFDIIKMVTTIGNDGTEFYAQIFNVYNNRMRNFLFNSFFFSLPTPHCSSPFVGFSRIRSAFTLNLSYAVLPGPFPDRMEAKASLSFVCVYVASRLLIIATKGTHVTFSAESCLPGATMERGADATAASIPL